MNASPVINKKITFLCFPYTKHMQLPCALENIIAANYSSKIYLYDKLNVVKNGDSPDSHVLRAYEILNRKLPDDIVINTIADDIKQLKQSATSNLVISFPLNIYQFRFLEKTLGVDFLQHDTHFIFSPIVNELACNGTIDFLSKATFAIKDLEEFKIYLHSMQYSSASIE